MKHYKENAGFTLVELIVVIAILAILAGVAVPSYAGYVEKAKEASDLIMLDAVRTAAIAKIIEKEPNAQLTELVVTPGVETVKVWYSVAKPDSGSGSTGGNNGGSGNTSGGNEDEGEIDVVKPKPKEIEVDDLVDVPEFESENSEATWTLKGGWSFTSGK